MKQSFLVLFLSILSLVSGFAPVNKNVNTLSRTAPSTQLQAAPTMVVYWSIKSAIDLVGYQMGMSDSFQGTGVWSGIKMEREPKDQDESKALEQAPSAKKTEKTPVSSSK